MKWWRLALVGMALVGCRSGPQIIQTGPDTYIAGASSMSGFKNDMKVTAVAMDRANAFCRKQGKVADMLSNQMKGHQMLTVQNAQISFRCLAPEPPPPASAPV